MQRSWTAALALTALAARAQPPTAPVSAPTASTDPLAAEIQFFEARLARDPEDTLTPVRLAGLYLRQAREREEYALYARAEALLAPLHERQPDHYATGTLLAEARAARHDFSGAIDLATHVLKLRPRDPAAWAVLFDAQLAAGSLEEAGQSLTVLREIAPGFESLTRQANLQSARGETAAALVTLGEALVLASERPVADRVWCHVRMGATHFDHGRWNEAESHYQEALRIMPQSVSSLEHLAELRAAEGHREAALAIYADVVKRAPQPQFQAALARLNQAVGRNAEAQEWFTQAERTARAQLARGDRGNLRFLALFYVDDRPDPDQAMRFAREDLEIRHDAGAHDTLAWVKFRAGELRQAQASSTTALELRPDDPALLGHAARIAAALGQAPRAADYARRALAANPRHRDREWLAAIAETTR